MNDKLTINYNDFQQQTTLKIIELIEAENLEMCYWDNYYKQGESRIFEIGDKIKYIRVVISDTAPIFVEYGKTTYGKNRFIKRAKTLNLQNTIVEVSDRLYPAQEIFKVCFKIGDINGIVNEIKSAFETN